MRRLMSVSGLALVAWLMSPATATAQPFISEIFFDPLASSEGAFEWVELHNPGATDVSLQGYQLHAHGSSTSDRTLTLGAQAVVPAGGYLLLASTGNLGGITPCNVAPIAWASTLTLYNTDNTSFIELLDTAAAVVDRVDYKSTPFDPAVVPGHSLSVVNVAAGNDDPTNWRAADCLYGTRNTTEQYFGTPGIAHRSCVSDGGVLDGGIDTDAGGSDASPDDGGISDASPGDGGDLGGPPYECLPVPDAGPIPDAGTSLDGGAGDASDAAVSDAGPPPVPAPFVSEIFFDAPGSSDNGLEWLELFNPTGEDVTLTGWTVRSHGSSDKTFAIPDGTVLPAGGVVLLGAAADLGVATCPVAHVTYGTALTLSNSSGPYVELVDPANAVVDLVAWLSSGFPTPSEAHSLAVRDLGSQNLNNDPSNWMVSDCAYGTRNYGTPPVAMSSFGTPGLLNTLCGGDAGIMLECQVVQTDGGPGRDAASGADAAGLLVARDAGLAGNQAPTVSVTEPASDGAAAGDVVVNWTASDPDGDTLVVTILAAPVGSGSSGTEVMTGLAANGPATWNASSFPPGVYRVLVQVNDGHGHVVVGQAPGTVQLGGAGGSSVLSVERPQGGEVSSDTLTISLRTNSSDGTLSVFYDSDSAGLDGTPIAGGIRARPGIVDIVWNTGATPAGDYFVYAVLEAPAGRASAYSSGAVTVRHSGGGCSCLQSDRASGSAALLGAAVLGAWMSRASRRRMKK